MEQLKFPIYQQHSPGRDVTPSLSYEDFLTLFNQAYLKEDIDFIVSLQKQYPDYLEKYANDKRNISLREDEASYKYPILADIPHFTKPRILNLLEYLLGDSFKAKKYLDTLENDVGFYFYYNYISFCTDRGYKPDSLWNTLFLKEPELHTRLEMLHIKSFDELVFRAVEYFEIDDSRHS